MTLSSTRAGSSSRLIALGLIIGTLLGACIGVVVLFQSIRLQRAQELVVWQSRLAQQADAQSSSIARWVDQRFTSLRALADNASLQIYMTGIVQSAGDATQTAEAQAQKKFLSDLLTVTAVHGGFTETPALPAELTNEHHIGHAGLALLAADRHLLIATADMPPLEGKLTEAIAALPGGRRSLIDFFSLADGEVVLGFIEPIYAVQSDPGPDTLVGYVLGVTKPTADLFATLKLPPPEPASADSTLVRLNGDMIEYVFSSGDADKLLARRLSRTTADLDVIFAVDHPGDFAQKIDYRGTPVLVTGRAIANTPWVVADTVSVDEALSATDALAKRNGVFLLLGTMLVIAIVLAAWRHGTSRRLGMLADEYRDLAQRYDRQRHRLRVITDTQSDAIYIVDRGDCVRFANRAFASRLGISSDDAVGKSLKALVGPAAATPILDAVARCLTERIELRETVRRGDGPAVVVIQTIYIPLPPDDQEPPSVLVIEHDVTATMAEREKREKALNELVAALTAAVDLRDEHAAHQSSRVAAVSRGIAEELGLESKLVATAETAGRLMNFGKAMAPPELLTRSGELSPEELDIVRKSIASTADIVSTVEFDGPVVHALRDATERWDGTGPRGLKAAEIPIVAQIIALANVFVAAAMPRAYRENAGVDHAMAEVQAQSGKAFDRRVVSALSQFIDNRGGRTLFDVTPPRAPDMSK